jgi:D-inositol-3-phosphate glycosyltransferase
MAPLHISLLTAGKDPHYALGLLGALTDRGIRVDFIANDAMRSAAAAAHPLVNYLNLRGDQRREAGLWAKSARLLRYYSKLIRYAVGPAPTLFHILWFNKFEWLDNTLLILLYKAKGRRLVYTVHNVSTAGRDGRSNWLNEWSLRFLYRNVDHLFVHTGLMKRELIERFGALAEKISTVPFPVNDVTPRSELDKPAARRALGLDPDERVLLFFGNIAPYKGVEDAVSAVARLPADLRSRIRLLIVGRIKDCPDYWRSVVSLADDLGVSDRIVHRTEVVPEEEVGLYFRAADVLLLPYRKIYQSGVLFLSYNQGLPVIAADVGALRESVVEGETGFVYAAADPEDLARKIESYFESPLYRDLEVRRGSIMDYVRERHSWARVAGDACGIYERLNGASA